MGGKIQRDVRSNEVQFHHDITCGNQDKKMNSDTMNRGVYDFWLTIHLLVLAIFQLVHGTE